MVPSTTGPSRAPAAAARSGVQAVLGWAALVVGAAPFLLLWLLLESWPPLARADQAVADVLHDGVSGRPLLVQGLRLLTDLAGTGAAVLVLGLTTVFLLVRRQLRLAAFAVTAGVGLAVLGPATKALVGRARPLVDAPVLETPSNASFPSGHAMTAVVVYGVLLLLALPAVRRGARPWLVCATVLLVVAIGATRLALGVHFLSDVVAGWALGAGWLGVAAAASRSWQHALGRGSDEPLDPLDVPPEDAPALTLPGPVAAPAPTARRAALGLLASAAGLAAVLTALGLLVTAALGQGWLARLDRAVVLWLLEHRSPALSDLLGTVSDLSGARAVVALGLALAVVGLAVTAAWRAPLFVATALLGQVALYAGVARVVDRARPTVADLTSGLPTGASWPSGHVGAAAALYGALAALGVVYGRSRWRWLLLLVPGLLVPAVALSRLYVAAHHPTDVLAGALLGGLWTVACARSLLPPAGAPVPAARGPARTDGRAVVR